MVARLEWRNRNAFGGYLSLGGWTLGAVWREASGGGRAFRYELQDIDEHSGGPYEAADDAFQDCEAEVRRLLKEAGVELE